MRRGWHRAPAAVDSARHPERRARHDGTSRAVLGCLTGLRQISPPWDVTVWANPAAVRFHDLRRLCGGWTICLAAPAGRLTPPAALSALAYPGPDRSASSRFLHCLLHARHDFVGCRLRRAASPRWHVELSCRLRRRSSVRFGVFTATLRHEVRQGPTYLPQSVTIHSILRTTCRRTRRPVPESMCSSSATSWIIRTFGRPLACCQRRSRFKSLSS